MIHSFRAAAVNREPWAQGCRVGAGEALALPGTFLGRLLRHSREHGDRAV